MGMPELFAVEQFLVVEGNECDGEGRYGHQQCGCRMLRDPIDEKLHGRILLER